MKTNVYAGICTKCGASVGPGDGLLVSGTDGRRFTVQHKEGDCRTATMPTKADTLDAKDAAVEKVIDLMAQRMAALVPELVKDNLTLLSRVTEIKVAKMPAVKVDLAHNMLEDILLAVVAGASPMIVGPAGSGKTTLAEQICTILQRPFYMEARVTSEFKLIGFIDAHGKVVRTQFREAYEHGGGFLFDEVDASDPDALTSFNAALANDSCPFPDGLVKRHPDFFAIAAGNTFGRGADRQYVGRNQLDAATLDRFQVFEVDYDEALESKLAVNAEWTKRVQAVRAAVTVEKVRHIVSPRASIIGAKLLAAGMTKEKVEEACIWKGLDPTNRARVASRLGETYHA
jgi:MoxR-like ATPase